MTQNLELNITIEQTPIARGACSTIYAATYNGKKCAVKTVHKSCGFASVFLEQEAKALNLLHSCPYIIPGLYFFSDMVHSYLFLEYCPYGNLQDVINDSTIVLNEKEYRYICFQLLSALYYAHNSACLCHRDIKPENVLIYNKTEASGINIYNVYLADWGFADSILNQANPLKGTYLFSPPERFTYATYSGIKADIWSLGATFYNLIVRAPPFDAENVVALMASIHIKNPSFPTDIPQHVCDIINSMLDKKPDKRPLTKELCRNTWFNFD